MLKKRAILRTSSKEQKSVIILLSEPSKCVRLKLVRLTALWLYEERDMRMLLRSNEEKHANACPVITLTIRCIDGIISPNSGFKRKLLMVVNMLFPLSR